MNSSDFFFVHSVYLVHLTSRPECSAATHHPIFRFADVGTTQPIFGFSLTIVQSATWFLSVAPLGFPSVPPLEFDLYCLSQFPSALSLRFGLNLARCRCCPTIPLVLPQSQWHVATWSCSMPLSGSVMLRSAKKFCLPPPSNATILVVVVESPLPILPPQISLWAHCYVPAGQCLLRFVFFFFRLIYCVVDLVGGLIRKISHCNQCYGRKNQHVTWKLYEISINKGRKCFSASHHHQTYEEKLLAFGSSYKNEYCGLWPYWLYQWKKKTSHWSWSFMECVIYWR